MHQFTRVAQARAACTSGSRREEGDVASGNGAASGLGNENLQACVECRPIRGHGEDEDKCIGRSWN